MDETPAHWLGHLPILVAAARTGSASAVSRELGIGTATVLRRLAALEEALGTPLFDRTPSGLVPTAALELALPWAEQIDAAAIQLQRELSSLETLPTGVVRLALLPTLAAWFVAPALPRLRARHPGLIVELEPAAAVVDLVRREADLALRAVRPQTGDLVTQRVATVAFGAFASPQLLDQIRPQHLADLPWVAWDARMAEAPEARWLGAAVPDATVVLRSADLESLVSAAQVGVGALVTWAPLAAEAGLVPVPLPAPAAPSGALWLVAHRSLRRVPRVAAVWDWLVEEFDARWSAAPL
jgi:DNA-binding transcriptional LysR family regulator